MSEQYNAIEEDEIDLRELWQTIVKGKKVIAIVMILVVTFAFVFVLKTPNVYKSQTILIPTSESATPSLGGLGGLAAMAGVSIGGSSVMTPDIAFSSLLGDYKFMKEFVTKNAIDKYYLNTEIDKNYVFALGFRGFYDLFKSQSTKVVDKDAVVFNVIKKLQSKLSISSDKKSGLITVSYSDEDRTYPPRVINDFLRDASTYLVNNNLRIINNKLRYFEKELSSTESFELRQSISQIVSKILEKKVVMQSKTYYQCDVLTVASPAYIKDKSKPKRALVLVVSFITSLILGIFLVFFLEFIKKEDS